MFLTTTIEHSNQESKIAKKTNKPEELVQIILITQ